MGDTCAKCGGYTVYVIGNYSQCPKCEGASKEILADTSKDTKDPLYVWGCENWTRTIEPGQSRDFWVEDPKLNLSTTKIIRLRVDGDYTSSPSGYNVIHLENLSDVPVNLAPA